jgi:hypothetical protein
VASLCSPLSSKVTLLLMYGSDEEVITAVDDIVPEGLIAISRNLGILLPEWPDSRDSIATRSGDSDPLSLNR